MLILSNLTIKGSCMSRQTKVIFPTDDGVTQALKQFIFTSPLSSVGVSKKTLSACCNAEKITEACDLWKQGKENSFKFSFEDEFDAFYQAFIDLKSTLQPWAVARLKEAKEISAETMHPLYDAIHNAISGRIRKKSFTIVDVPADQPEKAAMYLATSFIRAVFPDYLKESAPATYSHVTFSSEKLLIPAWLKVAAKPATQVAAVAPQQVAPSAPVVGAVQTKPVEASQSPAPTPSQPAPAAPAATSLPISAAVKAGGPSLFAESSVTLIRKEGLSPTIIPVNIGRRSAGLPNAPADLLTTISPAK